MTIAAMEMGLAATVGGRIRHLRLAKGLTLRQMAFDGCSGAHLSRIERGEKAATPAVLDKIASLLGVPAETFGPPVSPQPQIRRRRAPGGASPLTELPLKRRHAGAVSLLRSDQARLLSIEERRDLLILVVWPALFEEDAQLAA